MFPVHFLSTPAGVVCLFIIGGIALFNIYSPVVNDGLIGRLLYMSTVVVCAAGVIHPAPGIPDKVAIALIIIFAMRQVRNMTIRIWIYYRYRHRPAVGAKK